MLKFEENGSKVKNLKIFYYFDVKYFKTTTATIKNVWGKKIESQFIQRDRPKYYLHCKNVEEYNFLTFFRQPASVDP